MELTPSQQLELTSLLALLNRWESTPASDKKTREFLLSAFKKFWISEYKKRSDDEKSQLPSKALGSHHFCQAVKDRVISLAVADGMDYPKFIGNFEGETWNLLANIRAMTYFQKITI